MKTYTSAFISSPTNSALLDEIVQLITLSFLSDPWTRWLFNSHSTESYNAALPVYIRATIRLSLLCDASFTVLTTDDDDPSAPLPLTTPSLPPSPSPSTLLAVSVLIPPHGNRTFDSTFAAIRSGALTLPFTLGLRVPLKLFFNFLPALTKMHDQIFPDPSTKYHHYHLFYLASHPQWKGRGLGTKVLREVMEMVGETGEKGAPVYLESSTLGSRRLYLREGFEEVAVLAYGGWREGRAEEEDEEDVTVDEAGRVVGGRMWGMTWMPPVWKGS